MKPLASKPLVCIIWEDAHGSSLGDYAESEVEHFHQPATYTSFGLLLKRDDKGVSIASEWTGHEYRGLSFIPSQMIRDVIDLGLPKRPKRARVVPPV